MKNRILASVGLLAFAAGLASGEPVRFNVPQRDYFAGFAAYGEAVGDFNRDGKPDVVTTGTGILILLGNGDGKRSARTFSRQH